MRIIISLLVGLALVGCSSAPKVSAQKPQYCHTSQTITIEDGEKVGSRDVHECTDDEVKRLFHARSGMAPNCGVFTYWTKIGGRDVQRKGISCQKPDGSWEVVNTSGY
jgi:hypothetical protein